MNISAVVIAKNEEKYIENCLKCLKNQTLKPEIIVVDGHSTDKTVSIAKKHADKVVKDNNKGVADARNIGWKIAKGNIIAYCDADCLPPKHWIENISKLMGKNICVSGPLYSYDGDALMKVAYRYWTNFTPRFYGFLGLQYIWGSNMAIKKEILKKHPFMTNILEDYDLVRRIRKAGKVGFFKELLMPVSSRHLKYGFHISTFKFYVRNFLRLRFGFKEKSETYWSLTQKTNP
jgi:glycosyltransferase involved in cell wall biosynthesis